MLVEPVNISASNQETTKAKKGKRCMWYSRFFWWMIQTRCFRRKKRVNHNWENTLSKNRHNSLIVSCRCSSRASQSKLWRRDNLTLISFFLYQRLLEYMLAGLDTKCFGEKDQRFYCVSKITKFHCSELNSKVVEKTTKTHEKIKMKSLKSTYLIMGMSTFFFESVSLRNISKSQNVNFFQTRILNAIDKDYFTWFNLRCIGNSLLWITMSCLFQSQS